MPIKHAILCQFYANEMLTIPWNVICSMESQVFLSSAVLHAPRNFPLWVTALFFLENIWEVLQSHLKLETSREIANPLVKEIWIYLKFSKTSETCWSHLISQQGFRVGTRLAPCTPWCQGTTVLPCHGTIYVLLKVNELQWTFQGKRK